MALAVTDIFVIGLSGMDLEKADKMVDKANGCIVVGIGNPLLKDDRAGIEVVEALKARNSKLNTAVLPSFGIDVLSAIMGYEEAVIVDACQMGIAPGTVLELTPESYFDSHPDTSGQAKIVGAMLRSDQSAFPKRMPGKIRIILVEAEDMSTFSTKCTPVVRHAISDVVDRIQMATA